MVTASVDVNVLHRNLLLALTAVAVECVEQHRVRAGELVGLAQILTPAPEGLFKKHGPSIAFHRGAVSSDKLGPDHALDLVFRADPSERGPRRFVLTISRVGVGVEPKGLNRLVRKNRVPVIGLRSTEALQHTLQVIGTIYDNGCWFLLAASFFGTHCLILMFECPLRRAPRRFDIDRLRFLLVTSHHSERRREHFKKCFILSIMRIGVAIPSVRRSRS